MVQFCYLGNETVCFLSSVATDGKNIQWNPALRSLRYCGQFFLYLALIFPRNSTRLIWTLFIVPLGSIKWFGCIRIEPFQVLMLCMQKPPKNYGKCCLIEFFLIERFSYVLEVKTRKQNKHNKRKEIG